MTYQPQQKYIAILLTETCQKLTREHGSYAEMAYYAMVCAKIHHPCKIYTAYEGELPTEDELDNEIQGIWITGSSSDAYADDEWIVNLRDFITCTTHYCPDIPFVGICFGHQIISKALGARVGPNKKGWEYGVTKISINNRSEDVKASFGKRFGDSFLMQETHQDAVHTVPMGLSSIGFSAKTKHQGFYKRGQILTLQGHPELTHGYMKDLLAIYVKTIDYFKNSRVFSVSASYRCQLPHNGQELSELIVDHLEKRL